MGPTDSINDAARITGVHIKKFFLKQRHFIGVERKRLAKRLSVARRRAWVVVRRSSVERRRLVKVLNAVRSHQNEIERCQIDSESEDSEPRKWESTEVDTNPSTNHSIG